MNKYNKYSKDAMDVRSFINKINETAKILKEAYVYEDDIDVSTDEVNVEGNVEEQSMSDGKEFVDTIRKAALQGIQAFKDNVDSPSYDFFKKVFMLADKVLSEKDNEASAE